MTNLKQRIEEIEQKAAESELLSTLSTDEEARLAVELWEYAHKLRSQLAGTA